MTLVFDEDGFIETLPLCDEHGYPLLTNADGEEILDDFGEPIRLGFGNMQIEPVDTTLSRTEFVIRSLQY